MSWKAIDRYSKDYIELQTKDKVKFYKTPDSVLADQLKLWDAIVEKKSAENALFKEIAASQKVFAERAVKWDQDTYVSRKMAVNYFFGAKRLSRRLRTFRNTQIGHPGIVRVADFFEQVRLCRNCFSRSTRSAPLSASRFPG